MGKKVVFITGTDEHGEKIAAAAAASGSNPSEHCEVISQAYKMLWKDVIMFSIIRFHSLIGVLNVLTAIVFTFLVVFYFLMAVRRCI